MSDQELARKLIVLDARDKVLRQKTTKQTQLSQASSYTGSCPDMCPERERYTRMNQRTSIFERDPNTNTSDEHAMIKEYRRAGADQEEPLPHDLRTPKALQLTVDYLVCNIMDDQRSKMPEYALQWYDFLWDRLRAVRKDITQQNICNELSAILVERCTRFHVHSCYALNDVKDFDVNMNRRNLNDCLQMLRQIYNDLKVTYGIYCNGEFEFKKYDILLHLGEDALTTNLLMKENENHSMKEAKFITSIFNSYINHDYFKFFKLMRQADYMTSCILSLYINNMRLTGMRIILSACALPRVSLPYPANLLIESLGFDDIHDLAIFADHFGIEKITKESENYLLLKRDHIEAINLLGSTLPKVRSKKLVESKMLGKNVGQLVYGQGGFPTNPYKTYSLHTSEELYQKVALDEPFSTGQQDDQTQMIDHINPSNEVLDDDEMISEDIYCDDDNYEHDDICDEDEEEEDYDPDEEYEEYRACHENFSDEEIDEEDDAQDQENKDSSEHENSIDNGRNTFESSPHSSEQPKPMKRKRCEEDDDIELDTSHSVTKPKIQSNMFENIMKVPDSIAAPNHDQDGMQGLGVDDDDDDQDVDDPLDQLALRIKTRPVSLIADMMPAGKYRRSKRLMPKFAPVPTETTSLTGEEIQSQKQSRRDGEIESIKQWTTDEEKANEKFLRIVRMVIIKILIIL